MGGWQAHSGMGVCSKSVGVSNHPCGAGKTVWSSRKGRLGALQISMLLATHFVISYCQQYLVFS